MRIIVEFKAPDDLKPNEQTCFGTFRNAFKSLLQDWLGMEFFDDYGLKIAKITYEK